LVESAVGHARMKTVGLEVIYRQIRNG
jgi:hypothetical protein